MRRWAVNLIFSIFLWIFAIAQTFRIGWKTCPIVLKTTPGHALPLEGVINTFYVLGNSKSQLKGIRRRSLQGISSIWLTGSRGDAYLYCVRGNSSRGLKGVCSDDRNRSLKCLPVVLRSRHNVPSVEQTCSSLLMNDGPSPTPRWRNNGSPDIGARPFVSRQFLQRSSVNHQNASLDYNYSLREQCEQRKARLWVRTLWRYDRQCSGLSAV